MKHLLPDREMCSSSRSFTTSGCISGLLTRILCPRSAPTHLSYDANCDVELGTNPICHNPVAAPGIIARLMGLEQPGGGSIYRSRSMNSLEFGKAAMDGFEGKKKHHRRTKSRTMSLTENDEFLVLSFEEFGNRGDGKTEETEFIERMVSRILSEESAVRDRFFSGEETFHPSRENPKIANSRCQEATECCSSSSLSPVSVLDSSRQFTLDNEVSTSSEDSETEPSGKLKKVLLKRLPPDLWEGICKMAESDVVEGLNWNRMPRSKNEIRHFEIEMVGAELESYILDQLLDELVAVECTSHR